MLESFLKVAVHIAGDGFDPIHPINTDVIDEIIYGSLLLPMGNPQDVAGLNVNDNNGIPVPFMETELV